jgi:hypothetical protein
MNLVAASSAYRVATDTDDVRFEQCAYCQQPVEVTHLRGGWM